MPQQVRHDNYSLPRTRGEGEERYFPTNFFHYILNMWSGNHKSTQRESVDAVLYLFEKGITQGRQGDVYALVHEPKPDAGENLNQMSISY